MQVCDQILPEIIKFACCTEFCLVGNSRITSFGSYLLHIADSVVVMAALHSRCGHYIFVLFLSIFYLFSSPNLSGRRLDVYHTSTRGMALVQI